MGSLRNPVGPLPSSIYWRRRAVLASVFALLAIIATWAVSSGAKKTSTDSKGPGEPGSHAPITPGPSQSGPAISQYPGGRGESGGSGSEGTGGDSGTDPGADGGSGADAGTGKNGDPGSGNAGSGADPVQVPAGSPLPNCAPGAVRWSVRSVQNSYEPTEKPRLELVASNTSGTTCKVDLGPRTAVLTLTRPGDDKALWSSADCPADGAGRYYRVPAQSAITHAVEWDRKASDPAKCGSPAAGAAEAGTYLVEVRAPGLPVLRTSFVLAKD